LDDNFYCLHCPFRSNNAQIYLEHVTKNHGPQSISSKANRRKLRAADNESQPQEDPNSEIDNSENDDQGEIAVDPGIAPDPSAYYLRYYWWEIIVYNVDITRPANLGQNI
jgi:hypothetical protein